MPEPVPFDAEEVAAAKVKKQKTKPGVTTKKTICQVCDIAQIRACVMLLS